jgi:aminoglycoside phosphotransferase (APT) family kinase protein
MLRFPQSSGSGASRPICATMLAMTTDIGRRRIAGGREADIFDYGDGRVVRLFHDGAAKAWLEHEVVAMRAVRAVVPLVPEVFETTEIDGRPGIVMERIDGPDLLSRIASKPWTVFSAGKILGDTHARLHEVVAPAGIVSLPERAKQVAPRIPAPDDVKAWGLDALAAMPDGDRLLHGDFHPANVLLTNDGPRVIDWPNVTRGNPDADVARSLLMLRIGEVPPGSPLVVRIGQRFVRRLLERSYLRAYRRLRPVDQATLERWITIRAVDRLAENIPEERNKLLAIIASARRAPPSQ